MEQFTKILEKTYKFAYVFLLSIMELLQLTNNRLVEKRAKDF